MSPARGSKSSRAISSQQKELESGIIRWISEKERKGMLVGGTLKAQAFENKSKVRLSIQATTALAETTAIADFGSLAVFSAIYVVYCS